MAKMRFKQAKAIMRIAQLLIKEDIKRTDPKEKHYIKLIYYDPNNFSIRVDIENDSKEYLISLINSVTENYKLITLNNLPGKIECLLIKDIEL
jgi:hypothetical protein